MNLYKNKIILTIVIALVGLLAIILFGFNMTNAKTENRDNQQYSLLESEITNLKEELKQSKSDIISLNAKVEELQSTNAVKDTTIEELQNNMQTLANRKATILKKEITKVVEKPTNTIIEVAKLKPSTDIENEIDTIKQGLLNKKEILENEYNELIEKRNIYIDLYSQLATNKYQLQLIELQKTALANSTPAFPGSSSESYEEYLQKVEEFKKQYAIKMAEFEKQKKELEAQKSELEKQIEENVFDTEKDNEQITTLEKEIKQVNDELLKY